MTDGEPPAWKLFAEAVRLWLPVVVSVCAISLTVFQAMTARRHTRLSVQPRLEWRVEADTRTGVFEVTLVNVGLGPAILKSAAIAVDGTERPFSGLETCAVVSEALGRTPEAFDTHCFVQSGDRVIRDGESLSLYQSVPAPGTTPDATVEDYRRLSVSGTYCSFYEDCWQIASP